VQINVAQLYDDNREKLGLAGSAERAGGRAWALERGEVGLSRGPRTWMRLGMDDIEMAYERPTPVLSAGAKPRRGLSADQRSRAFARLSSYQLARR